MAKSSTENEHSYWQVATEPLPCLVFVAPLLLVYELGIILLGKDAIRNGADVLLRRWIDLAGFGQYFLLPLVVCGVMLGWHHLTGRRWRMSIGVLLGMLLETIVWSLLLLAVAHLHGRVFTQLVGGHEAAHDVRPTAAVSDPREESGKLEIDGVERDPTTKTVASRPPLALSSQDQQAAKLVAFCGAGLYEELLFRLIMLSVAIAIIGRAGGSPQATVVVAVIVTSLLFSAAHYRIFTGAGDEFQLLTYVFRFIAGVFFSVLFLKRGFGITAGTHTLYDVLVGFLL
jgi:hypothetical protein